MLWPVGGGLVARQWWGVVLRRAAGNALREPRRVVPTVRRAFRATPQESGPLPCSSSRGRYRTLPRDTTVPDLRLEVWRWSACVGLLEEVPLLACWLSLDFLFRTLSLFIGHECLSRSSVPRWLACSCRGRRNLWRFLGWLLRRTLDVLRLSVLKLDVRETHPRHKISALEIPVHLLKAADLARHH